MTAPDPGMAVPAPSPLLAGFEHGRMDVDGVTMNHAIGGAGPPLLLLHGYPENHLMWRHVAPVLAEDHTVVLADLRGYGDSGKPAPDAAGLVYAKRSMAGDQAGLMRQLGFGQFGLIGHDRGARVAHRLVLDHPGVVTRLAVLDIVPTRHVLGNVTRAMATAYYHWFFLATPNGVPERMIAADPGFWVRSLIGPLLGPGASIEPPVMDDYVRCFNDHRTIVGSCADYRAAASTDLVHDEQTFATGQRIECPVLALWGTQAFVGRGYEPLSVWQQYATDVRGTALPTGHFLPEEAPGLVTAALRDFLGLTSAGTVAADAAAGPYANSLADVEYMFARSNQLGAAPSISVFEPGFLRTTLAWQRSGRLPPGVMVKLYFGGEMEFRLRPTATALEAYLELLEPSGLPWSAVTWWGAGWPNWLSAAAGTSGSGWRTTRGRVSRPTSTCCAPRSPSPKISAAHRPRPRRPAGSSASHQPRDRLSPSAADHVTAAAPRHRAPAQADPPGQRSGV